MSIENAHRIADTIKPMIELIDREIADDYAYTFEHCRRLDFIRADPRHETRKAWDTHYLRTEVLRRERTRIIECAAMVISHMADLPVIVCYQGGEPV